MPQQHRISRNNPAILRDPDGTLTVVLHSTRIVTVAANGDVTLNSGGYRTATTRTCMNQVASEWSLPYRVYQKDRDWYVTVPVRGEWHTVQGSYPFEDGMTITQTSDGDVFKQRPN